MAENNLVGTFNVLDNSVAVIASIDSPLDYLFRYRLITDEGEALSQWSRVNSVTLKEDNSVSNIVDGFDFSTSVSSVESGGVGINVSWDMPDNFPTSRFDIYFSWSYENAGTNYTDFEYADTITSNNYFIKTKVNPLDANVKAKRVKVMLQVPTNIKIANTNAKIFESLGYSTLPILDAGTI